MKCINECIPLLTIAVFYHMMVVATVLYVFLHIVNVVIHLTLKLRWCIALLNNMVSPTVNNFYFISSPISVSPSLNSLIKVEHFKNVSMFQQQESVSTCSYE